MFWWLNEWYTDKMVPNSNAKNSSDKAFMLMISKEVYDQSEHNIIGGGADHEWGDQLQSKPAATLLT